MSIYEVQLKETCVRTTTINVNAESIKEARKIAKQSSYGENDFSVVSCEVDVINVIELTELNDKALMTYKHFTHRFNGVVAQLRVVQRSEGCLMIKAVLNRNTFNIYLTEDQTKIDSIYIATQTRTHKLVNDIPFTLNNVEMIAIYLIDTDEKYK